MNATSIFAVGLPLRPILLLLCLRLGLLCFSSTPLWAAEFFIGNHQGDAKAFDSEMRSLPENATIHLTDALYHTEGVWQINNKSGNPHLPGFRLKNGWHISGKGTNQTTMKLTNVFVAQGNHWQEGKNFVFAGWDYTLGKGNSDLAIITNATVENLTIDCNGPALTNQFSYPLKLSAIRMVGDNITVNNVKVINAVTEQDNENFILYMKGKDLGNGPGRCYVLNSVIEQYRGGYCSGITIGGRWGDGALQGTAVVSNNTVVLNGEGNNFGLNASGGTRNVTFVHNTVRNAGRGFNNDTGNNNNISLIGNTFTNVGTGFYIKASRSGLCTSNRVWLAQRPRSRCYGLILMPHVPPVSIYGADNWEISHNQIRGNLYENYYPDAGILIGFRPCSLCGCKPCAGNCPIYWSTNNVVVQNDLIGEHRELENMVSPYFHNVIQPGNVTGKGEPARGYPSDYLDGFPADNARIFCRSYAQNTTREWIESVELNEWKHQSGDNKGYFDGTSQAYQNPENAPRLLRGQSYQVALHPGFLHQPAEQFWNVFIDWNQNGIFAPSETVLTQSSDGIITAQIEVPPKAVLGGFTLMRLQMNPKGFLDDPCAVFAAGEVEDYLLRVAQKCP